MSTETTILSTVLRTKTMNGDSILDTQLDRCVSLFDLTMFGISNMLGGSIYVVTGNMVRFKAGPAAIVSYLIAGFAALLCAMCYAELASRIPRAGSSYTYTYLTIGELCAFVVGWSVILEYVLSGSTLAKGCSGTLDSMLNHTISRSIADIFGEMNVPILDDQPDILAFLITIVLTATLCLGANVSMSFNNITTALNLVTVAIFLTVMFIYADPSYVTESDFMPYGFGGVVSAAATGFYAYIGFDAVAIASEETKNPARVIPLACAFSIAVTAGVLIITTVALVFFVPYWQVSVSAAFTDALFARGFAWTAYQCGVGALLGTAASLLCTLYALPRVVYAIANDGLLFRFLAYVHPKTKVPIFSTILFGVASAIFALFFRFETLADLLSIGTLIAYTMVNANTVMLRYSPIAEDRRVAGTRDSPPIDEQDRADSAMWNESINFHDRNLLEHVNSRVGRLKPKYASWKIFSFVLDASPGYVPGVCLSAFFIFAMGFDVLIVTGWHHVRLCHWWAVLLVIIFVSGMVFTNLVMMAYERNDELIVTFKVPLMPILPNVSSLLNILLIAMLSPFSWLRFIVWLVVGLIIYFMYGIKNSVENVNSPRNTDYTVIEDSEPIDALLKESISINNDNSIQNDESDTELLLRNSGVKYS